MAALAADAPSTNGKPALTVSTSKRDELIQHEKRFQKLWQDHRVFEADAPALSDFQYGTPPAELRSIRPKWFGTMAYPYMNGTLHAGHSFTASKVEFAAGVARLNGCNALLPLGYHCTGMPIRACSDKLVREIDMFGKDFENYTSPAADEEETLAPTQTTKEDLTKFVAKKSKAAAKTVKVTYQFQIMLSLGIPLQDIQKFADPNHWIAFFPALCKRDLVSFGCRIDWRRSMVTTDANPYYDSFVRWQMKCLRDLGKIKFGKRYTVYSPKDGQACMDHNRSEGDGVGVQQYTAVKLKVVQWSEAAAIIPTNDNVYFVAATLRPETMYGQTCCFVGPSITYGIYKAGDDFYVCTPRAARNMAFQNILPWAHVAPPVVQLQGWQLIGTIVSAPLSVHGQVRILPMESIKASKGTGVVTSVPSYSPDDYATVMELAKKAAYYKIGKEWAELAIIPVIRTPAYGDVTAKFLVESMKINSPNDTKLAAAKDAAYKEGYYKGIMLIGDFKGDLVIDAKTKIHQQLLDSGDAFEYAEPDGFVLSRSGDECVVAHLDQWYLNYGKTENGGDGDWLAQVVDWVNNGLETFSVDVKNAIVQSLDWLSQWACARSYGLGTRLPWDDKFVVESLSDSTVYPAYYTIAHLLHNDVYGRELGPAQVKAEQMTDQVWDYIFARREGSGLESNIPQHVLHRLRREFEYWYPLDLRVSGKDLLPNHLCFCLYTHAGLFSKDLWPQTIRANGHLLLNGAKMSKSTGNFLTLKDAVEFGADATRISLADAGDSMDDANFDESVANSIILRMYELREWCKGVVKDAVPVGSREDYAKAREQAPRNADFYQRTGPLVFHDKIFQDELNGLVKVARGHYNDAMFKAALKAALYDFVGARDAYREACKTQGIGMHVDVCRRYVELQALMISPIAPHWAEYIWLDVLDKDASIQLARFPSVPDVDSALAAARDYARSIAGAITSAEAQQHKKVAKGKAATYDPWQDTKISIYVAQSFPTWYDDTVEIVKGCVSNGTIDVKMAALKLDTDAKRAMPFILAFKSRVEAGEPESKVFESKLPFDEIQVLKETIFGLRQAVQKCTIVEIVSVDIAQGGTAGKVVGRTEGVVEEDRDDLPVYAKHCMPGQPSFGFENV